jgi:hypothetical protein
MPNEPTQANKTTLTPFSSHVVADPNTTGTNPKPGSISWKKIFGITALLSFIATIAGVAGRNQNTNAAHQALTDLGNTNSSNVTNAPSISPSFTTTTKDNMPSAKPTMVQTTPKPTRKKTRAPSNKARTPSPKTTPTPSQMPTANTRAPTTKATKAPTAPPTTYATNVKLFKPCPTLPLGYVDDYTRAVVAQWTKQKPLGTVKAPNGQVVQLQYQAWWEKDPLKTPQRENRFLNAVEPIYPGYGEEYPYRSNNKNTRR